jgi:hypothetical protein
MTANLEERLVEFARRASLKDLSEAATFTRVTPGTVLNWITVGPLPKGEVQLRLLYYLELKGLAPAELQALPKPAYVLGSYIAYGMLEIEDAQRGLDYANTKEVYNLLRGSDLTSTRAEKLEEVLAEYKPKMESAFQGNAILPFVDPEAQAEESTKAPAPPVTPAANEVTTPSFAATHAAGSLLNATAMVELLILSGEPNTSMTIELVGRNRVNDLIENLQELIK